VTLRGDVGPFLRNNHVPALVQPLKQALGFDAIIARAAREKASNYLFEVVHGLALRQEQQLMTKLVPDCLRLADQLELFPAIGAALGVRFSGSWPCRFKSRWLHKDAGGRHNDFW
jgi:hypothetical protein